MNHDNIWIFNPNNDKDNFLEPPPGVNPQEWLARLKNLCREVFYLRDGSINLLDNLLRNLYENNGIFAGSRNYPCLRDLLNLIERIEFKPGTRFSGYHESLVNRFRGLDGELGETFACKRGYDIQRFEGKLLIYETGGLSDDKRNFYIYLKLLKQSAYYETLPPKPLRTLVIVEEAHKLFNEKIASRYDLGEGILIGSSRTSRKLGSGYLYSDQDPSSLPSPLSGNVNQHVIMRLVNGKSVRFASQTMNLTPDRTEFVPMIPKKHFLFQSPDYPEPVLAKVPDLKFEHVSDEEVALHMEKILPGLAYVPVEEAHEITGQGEGAPLPGETQACPGAKPSKTCIEICKTLAEVRWISLSNLYAHLGNLSPWIARKVVAKMEKQGLIETCLINFGTRGNPKTFVVLRPRGAELVGLEFDEVRLQGKGSTEHVILQNVLAETMKDSGKTVEIEHLAMEKFVDIAEIRPDGAVAYEIELAPSHPHVAENVKLDLGAGFDEVVVITRNQTAQNEARDQIYKAIPWEQLARVKFRLLREFL